MVISFSKCLLVCTAAAFILTGCHNDIFGLLYSEDLSGRWQARNTFNLLTDADRNIPLGDRYSFLVLSDTHIQDGNAWGLEKLREYIDSDVKFVVFNGDITQNGKREDIEQFIEIAKILGVPCYPAVGNHDVFFRQWPVWEELIGSTCYRINGGTTTLLIMDSADMFFGAKQLDWLEHELNNSTDRVFIFSHANLFVDSLKNGHQFTDIRERARVTSLLRDHCDIMFSGHVHERIIRKAGGVTYITTDDYRKSSEFCRVSVSKDGIQWQFMRL